MEELFYDAWELGLAELQTYFIINDGKIDLVLSDGKERVVTPLAYADLKDAIACAEGLKNATMDGKIMRVYIGDEAVKPTISNPLQEEILRELGREPKIAVNFKPWYNRPDRVKASLRGMARDGVHFNPRGWY